MGGIAEQAVKNRDGSTIHAEFSFEDSKRPFDKAYTVTTTTGDTVRFEHTGDKLDIYLGDTLFSSSQWTPDGPEATFEPANALAIEAAKAAATAVLLAGMALYNWHNSRPETLFPEDDSDGSIPVISFRAKGFEGRKSEPLTESRTLSKEEVDRACPRHPEVLERTEMAVRAIRSEEQANGYKYSQAEFGRRVHKHLENQIKSLGLPNFTAETTFSSIEEIPRFGSAGSIRTDVFEELPNGTICVYDVKTGKAPLGEARMRRIAAAIKMKYGTMRTFIIIDVRPPTS